MNGKRL